MKKRMGTSFFLFLAFIFWGIVLSVRAQDSGTTDRWTPAYSMKYKSIGGTAISPDGQWIAYIVREPLMEGEKSEYLSHIWLVSADGRTNVQYTRGEKACSNPSFSPCGKYLAFMSSRSEKNQVWVMRVSGGEAEQVTDAESGVGAYAWSLDGAFIAYTMQDPETEKEKKQKKEKRDVILVDQDFKYAHLYKTSIQKNKEGKRDTKQLTSGDFHVTDFDWSPDGRSIVFSHQPDPRINTGFQHSDISVVPADSGAVTRLVGWPGVDSSPLYSPDGKWVAFSSHGGKPEPVGLRDLYLVSSAGGDPKKLADTPDRNVGILGWSKDGKTVYVIESIRTTRHVLTVPIDGKAPRFVTSGDGVIGSVSIDKESKRMAFTYETPDLPTDVYLSSIKKFEKIRLTDVHAEIPELQMGRTAVISWESKDGLEIEGLLTYPVDYVEGRRYPLIADIHGGPAGVFSQSFTGSPGIYMLQYFAQNGYAIFRPNPRGSTGYGKDFRYANVKDWGFGDFEDIMSGVDKVIEMGVAHEDSLCVMGWSYGGYMTSTIVTKTNRFKAASMGAGLPNLVSMTTTTDIPDYLTAHMGGEYWDDYETYERHSAMYRIKNVTTPTQVIHGQNDLRVPFTQGQEFYVAIQRRGVPTEMVVYPRTPHGPREPKFLMDVSARIMKWFEKYLRGRDVPEGGDVSEKPKE